MIHIPRWVWRKHILHQNSPRNSFRLNHMIRSRYITVALATPTPTVSNDPGPDDDLMRWEEMYQQGGLTTMSDDRTSFASSSEIRVVTFDLDNTLWNTSVTIDDANNALALSLEMNLPDYTNSTIRVETIMGQLYKKNKALYCPLEGGLARSPVLLTQLRKDAIRTLYLEHCRPSAMKSDMELTEFIDAAFDMWTQARYDSILTNMARSVHDCLQHVQNIRTMSGGSILVGAITDGNSNPLVIPHLSNYFDFCVNAEMVGISKPDKRLYLHAVARALEHETLSDMLPKGRNSESAISNDELEELVGPWWVHIGDDFVKDIVAAKNLNMRCIWARELILEKIAEDIAKSAATPQKRKTVEELVQMVSEMKVVEMQIGADDYLVDSLQREFADAIVDEFADVSTILKQWQLEAYNAKNPGDATDEPLPSSRDDPSPAKETALVDDTSISAALSPSDTKFCISCGQKLPTVAKFCSSCGSKQ